MSIELIGAFSGLLAGFVVVMKYLLNQKDKRIAELEKKCDVLINQLLRSRGGLKK